MLKKYKHIIWDWNGTLFNDVGLSLDLINGLLSKRGLPILTLKEYRDVFTFPVRDYYCKAGFDFTMEPFEIVGKEWMDGYERRKYEGNLHDGTIGVLEKIASYGIGQSILSAYSQDSLEEIIGYYGLKKYFDHICGLDNIYATSKVQLGKDLMKKLEHGIGETLIIGDTEHDYDVAMEIGADCVLIANGHQSLEKLSRYGVVFQDLKDLLTV
jgi:phosphoglycolate phosphatase